MDPWTREIDRGYIDSGWSTERHFSRDRVTILSRGDFSDDQPGQMLVDHGGSTPTVIDLPDGYAHTRSCAAADEQGVTVLADRLGDDEGTLDVLLYLRP